ncbi:MULTISPECIES: universal stress protein [unclassified Streptomyces]|uniref:universal stress protein n=1 Tax=unclassified Streptomyces TaxID=2593676 RepID=UPI00278C86DA|nr:MULTISPECIES: universal stress protein [unclassified Streptomyces]
MAWDRPSLGAYEEGCSEMAMVDDERGGGRVVVGVGGSPASLAAVRSAVAEARRSGRPLVAVTAWEPPEGEALYRRWPDSGWARHWHAEARARLAGAFEEALGGLPADLDVTLRVVRDRPGPALVELADRPDDLLVVGVRPRSLVRAAHRHVRRHAVCPVLSVPVRPLQRAELRALRRVRPTDFGVIR